MNPVESILLENIGKPGSLFVFPTDVAASCWADRLLHLAGGTAAMEQFTAWDTFKQNSVKSKVQKRRSVPSALRGIFVSRLIQENAERCGRGETPLFVSLIPEKWAGQAASFANWFTALLPQLGAWFSMASGMAVAEIGGEGAARAAAGFDSEDGDLYRLALRYAQFLEQHGLFEPAWEKPPFDDTGTECFIFFPESLSDFEEYRELLSRSGHVRLVSAPDAAPSKPADVFFYTNSRSEISGAALYIMSLHEKEHIPWDSIALSIPDAETYEPYVLREFTNRNIPFVKRTGKPLASYPAGQFFNDIAVCVSTDFSFSSLAALLLNRHLPWKDGMDIQNLIDFGIQNNCISSWVEEENGRAQPVNVWEDAFKQPFGYISPAARRFFEDLKWRVRALRGAKSFAELRKHYFVFRERFFDMEKCLDETNLVLSRCIKELVYLADIEKSFPDVPAPDPYLFFAGHLREVTYLARQEGGGVAILPYRTAAPAPFDCHVIVGASQESLSMVFSRMAFLPRSKRKKLGIADDDVSETFINLHSFNSAKPAAFFCAEQTFSGYAIPHSLLNAPVQARRDYLEDPENSSKFSEDLFAGESAFLRRQSGGAAGAAPLAIFPARLHQNQKEGFAAWLSRRKTEVYAAGWTANTALLERIHAGLCGTGALSGKIKVSASSLAPYFQCSLLWLFERVLQLENVRIEAGLMQENVSGIVYHAILNHFFTGLKNSGAALEAPRYSGGGTTDSPSLPGTCREMLSASVETILNALPVIPPGEKSEMSALSARLLRAGKKEFYFILEHCLAAFLSWFAGFRIVETEQSYTLERSSSCLSGTVDCILEDSREHSQTKGSRVIVDFKLKNLPKRRDCTGEGGEGLLNFQLPMYLSLVEGDGNTTTDAALFFSIVDAEPEVLFGVIRNIEGGVDIPKKEKDRILRGSDRFRQIMNEFEEKAERFARETASGEFSAFSGNYERCAQCGYNSVCRTIYRINRERYLTPWGNNNGA